MFIDAYSPIPREQLLGVMEAAQLLLGERFLDLGSGDGRVLSAALERGAIVRGCEIDAELVRKTRPLFAEETIIHGDFMDLNWSEYDVLFHQTEKAVIEAKFHTEKKPGARLIFDGGENMKVVR